MPEDNGARLINCSQRTRFKKRSVSVESEKLCRQGRFLNKGTLWQHGDYSTHCRLVLCGLLEVKLDREKAPEHSLCLEPLYTILDYRLTHYCMCLGVHQATISFVSPVLLKTYILQDGCKCYGKMYIHFTYDCVSETCHSQATEQHNSSPGDCKVEPRRCQGSTIRWAVFVRYAMLSVPCQSQWH